MTTPKSYEALAADLASEKIISKTLICQKEAYMMLADKGRLDLSESKAREDALREELAALRESYEAMRDRKNSIVYLQQRMAVAERDARRYRYLREGAVMHYMSAEGSESKDAYLTITGYGHDDSAASIDNAIDAQMLAALNPAEEVEGS